MTGWRVALSGNMMGPQANPALPYPGRVGYLQFHHPWLHSQVMVPDYSTNCLPKLAGGRKEEKGENFSLQPTPDSLYL
jgi:hypothetical protein